MSDVRPAVRLSGVTASPAPGAPEVLRGVGLELTPGTTTAVTGPNGAGKSTLCRVVAGLVTPTAGTVEVGGVALRPGVPAPGVAMLFQSPRRSVSPRMTLRQAVAEPLELRGAARRPVNRHPPRKVPSSERYPCTPPPPKPLTSPAANSPGTGAPASSSTAPSSRVASPPSVLRLRIRSRTAISGPAPSSSSACGGTVRISLSPR